MLLFIAIAGVVALLLLIAVARLNAFLAFLLVSFGIGLAGGLDLIETVTVKISGTGISKE